MKFGCIIRQYESDLSLIKKKSSGSQDLDLLVSAVEKLMGIRLRTEALMLQTVHFHEIKSLLISNTYHYFLHYVTPLHASHANPTSACGLSPALVMGRIHHLRPSASDLMSICFHLYSVNNNSNKSTDLRALNVHEKHFGSHGNALFYLCLLDSRQTLHFLRSLILT